jgi:hypothetical protein
MSTPTMMETAEGVSTITETARKALQANKDHQYALKVYTERLEAELKAIDKMLVCNSNFVVKFLTNVSFGRIPLIY